MERNARSLLLPLIVGGVQALLTLNLEKLSTISNNPFLGGVQRCLVSLLLPGMFGSMAMGGNVHAWSLWVAAGLNGIIYFGLILFAASFASYLVKRRA
jgi:hypothetical protein